MVIIFSVNIGGRIKSFINTSNSMSPFINTGSITVVKKFNEYQAGDIITYYVLNKDKEEIITHRIVSIGGNVYVTKGDANQVKDRVVVLQRLVIGKVVLVIPYLGYLVGLAKGTIGIWLVIVFPASLIMLAELYKIYIELKN